MSGIPLNLPSALKTFCSPVQPCYHNTSLLFTAGGQLYAQSELPLGSLLFWDITQRMLVFIDVSGQPVVSTLKGQVVQNIGN
jgi:hypothetical protein